MLRRIVFGLFLGVVFASSPARGARVVWQIADGGNGHAYEAVAAYVTWYQANSGAQAAGGHLVTITSAAENQFVFELVNSSAFWLPQPQYNMSSGPWLGGFQPPGSPEPGGGWRWVTDEPFSYTNWHSGEPSNSGIGGKEDHLHFWTQPTYARAPTWNDSAAGLQMPGYIIEYESPDIIATSLGWNSNQGGVDFRYQVTGANLPQDTSARLYWATGPTKNDITSPATQPLTIPKTTPLNQDTTVHVAPGDFLGNPPAGTTHLVLVVDPDNAIIESNEDNNVKAVATPHVTIQSIHTPTFANGQHTFLSTDTITLSAGTGQTLAGQQVVWTVDGLEDAAGITGFPSQQASPTDGQGISSFSFRPTDNPAYAQHRSTLVSRANQRNTPIAFNVVAETTLYGISWRCQLSQANLGDLRQDDTDVLRQEYLDFFKAGYSLTLPGWSSVVDSLGAPWNKGPYGKQLSDDLPGRYNRVLAAYRGRSVIINGQPAFIPTTAAVTVSSAYRNPRYNLYVGSTSRTMPHASGRALDLYPVPVSVIINGRRVYLDLHGCLYPALYGAARAVGTYVIAESATAIVPVGDPREDHIHVQW